MSLYNPLSIVMRAQYNIICLQETWFDSKITNEEIISSTSFNIVRHDRSCFKNIRLRGGGVVTLLRRNIEFTVLNINAETSLEHQIIRIKFGNDYFCLLNIYLPPYRARLTMVNEVAAILKNIRNAHPLESRV